MNLVAEQHNAVALSRPAYAKRPSVLRATPAAIALAGALAAVTFAVVPFFGILSEAGHGRIEAHAVDTVSLPAPPPPHVRTELKPERRPKPRALQEPRPKPRKLRRPLDALKARISRGATSLMAGAGDFSLDFGIAPGDELSHDGGGIVFDIAELDSPPRPLARVRPLYPFRARERGTEGFVRLAFVVRADGPVGKADVVRAEPEGVFDRAALAAIRRWRFDPGTKDGNPVAARVRLTMRFQIEQE